jgi:hypothetical protein
MKYFFVFFIVIALPVLSKAQGNNKKTIYTVDIDNFWTAYDSVKTTTDTLKQQHFIQSLYVDKGTEGLKAFMEARNYNAKLWVKLINKYPLFWNSVRPNTLEVKKQVGQIEKSLNRFKRLYPELKPAKMYFTIGGLRSGGTTNDDMVLVGTEITAADKNTNSSELGSWLKGVFNSQDISNIVYLNVHEYVHTQQKQDGHTVLSKCIQEGSADFIAELVTKEKNQKNYMLYGREHEPELKEKFKTDLFSSLIYNWLYNGSNVAHADLGYFMGYQICKAYYDQSSNPKQAIKDIIELNFADDQQVTGFLNKSGYYDHVIDKK